MSSKILRPDSPFRLEPLRWQEWSTDRVDPLERPAVRELEPAPPDPEALDRARREGRSEGEAAAHALLSGQIQSKCAEFDSAIASVAAHKQRLRHEAERDVVQLAIAIARRILAREIRTDPDALLGLVKAAVEKLNARELIEIRLAAPLDDAVDRLGLPHGVKIAVDPSLEPGGVLITTTRGDVDASVGTQLEEIGRGLADVLASGRYA